MTDLQISDVPDDVLQLLMVRAAAAGQSLSEYALTVLRSSAEKSTFVEKPTLAEYHGRLRRRGRIGNVTTEDIVAIIRAERDAR
jgi:plasmid stability protein